MNLEGAKELFDEDFLMAFLVENDPKTLAEASTLSCKIIHGT